jgi:hypothetical protein
MIFLVVSPCSSDKGQCFGGIYFLHLQDRRVSEARYQLSACFFWFLAWLVTDGCMRIAALEGKLVDRRKGDGSESIYQE